MSPRLRLPSWRNDPLRFFAVVFLLALSVAGVERLGRLFASGNEACWIWAEGDYNAGTPLAFYAAREIEFEEAGAGRIAIAADETYLLYVNGQRIGAGAYRPAAPIDEYEVSDYLEVGVNRILVELRSSRGAGGFLAEIELDGGRRVVTDGGWRIFRRYDPGLFAGRSGLDRGEVPRVWQRPPTGRWRLGAARVSRPIPFQGFPPPERRRPLRFQQQQGMPWLELDPASRRIPALGPHQLYDWGEEVEGYLFFDLTSAEGEPGLLYFGSEPPDPPTTTPDEVLLPVPGRRHWEDAHPRRFRYLMIVGAEPYGRIEVELLESDLARQLRRPPAGNGGVFGFAPPRSYAMVEEEVWKRLERGADQGETTGSNVSSSSSAPSRKR